MKTIFYHVYSFTPMKPVKEGIRWIEIHTVSETEEPEPFIEEQLPQFLDQDFVTNHKIVLKGYKQ